MGLGLLQYADAAKAITLQCVSSASVRAAAVTEFVVKMKRSPGGRQRPTPRLVKQTSSASIKSTMSAQSSVKSETLSYLSSYEEMVKSQDREFSASKEYLTVVFKMLKRLGRSRRCRSSNEGTSSGLLSYLEIRRCLLRLGQDWSRSVGAEDCHDYDDESVSGLSVFSAGSFNSTSALAGTNTANAETSYDVISTDSQLMMLLRSLVELEERHRASRKMTTTVPNRLDEGLYLPDFVLSYKVIVEGLNSMKSSHSSGESGGYPKSLLLRLRGRTEGSLRPFFSPSWNMYAGHTEEQKQEGGHLPEKSTDVSKLLRSKDSTLTSIMEEQKLELEALATTIEELKEDGGNARDFFRKGRRRLWLTMLLTGGCIIATGINLECRRRKHIRDEIASHRQKERERSASLIAQLIIQKESLQSRLNDVESTARLKAYRNVVKSDELAATRERLTDVDMKYLTTQHELENCYEGQAVTSNELEQEQKRFYQIEEERSWCNVRLSSKERELNELEFWSGENESAQIEVLPVDVDRPVYLEMKYNRQIRHAMIKRQIYSALGGLAGSFAIQAILKKFVPAPVVEAVIPVKAVRNFERELGIVDGIFGSSLAFIVFKAILSFF